MAYDHQAEGHRVSLQVAAKLDLDSIDVDEERMMQVLGNLISNALRHTPPGGRVTLGASQEADRIHLTVADTGEGIPDNNLSKVFERFYRGETSRQREDVETGLGLAITKSITEAHGGKISVDSEIDQGSTFTISLPAVPRS
jgi:signal transduction histidine kinase